MDEVIVLVGRTSPDNGLFLREDRVGELVVETWSYTFTETYVRVPRRMLEKIAEHYGKKPEDLSEEEIEEYLIEVMRIDEQVEGKEHSFTKEW